MIAALAETIHEVKQVPSGVLYAGVMNHMTLDQYEACIEQLKRTGLVRESNHLLIWQEPKLPSTPDSVLNDQVP